MDMKVCKAHGILFFSLICRLIVFFSFWKQSPRADFNSPTPQSSIAVPDARELRDALACLPLHNSAIRRRVSVIGDLRNFL